MRTLRFCMSVMLSVGVLVVVTGSETTNALASGSTPVQTGASSPLTHAVESSPHGDWHAVALDVGAPTQRFLVSTDGTSWTTVTPPTTQRIASFAISDSGELYEIATDTSGSNYKSTDFWRYTGGGWSTMVVFGGHGGYIGSSAGELLTDGSTLIAVERESGNVYTSTDDGATWSAQQRLPQGFDFYGEQAFLAGGILHVLMITSSGTMVYQRWSLTTGAALAVDAPPAAPSYQWTPYMFTAPGSTSTIYVAAVDRAGGMYIYKTADSGQVWVTMVANDPFPTEFGSASGFAMGADGRIHAFAATNSAGSTTILQVSHGTTATVGDWSSTTSLATVPGDSASIVTWPTQHIDGGQPLTIDAWVSVPHGSSTYDDYWLTADGVTVNPATATAFNTSGSTVLTGLPLTGSPPISVVASPQHVWQVALLYDTGAGAAAILKSQDGVHWTQVPVPVNTAYWSLAIGDNGEIYAATQTNPNSAYPSSSLYKYVGARWYGPSIYDTFSGWIGSGPSALLKVGADLIGIERPSGRMTYSTDDGNTWSQYGPLSISLDYASSCTYAVVDANVHVLCPDGQLNSHYARWSRVSRSELAVTTPPVIPQYAHAMLLPQRDLDQMLWIAYVTTGNQVGLDESTDNGANWTTVDVGTSAPTGFTVNTDHAQFAIGGDDKLYTFGSTTGTNSAYASRRLASPAGWSAPGILDSQRGGSTYVAVPNSTASPTPPDVWLTTLTNTSGNPWRYEIDHYGKLGGPAPIPDMQTYGPSSAPPIFAARPVASMSDPVNSATGSFSDQITDASLPALGEPIAMTRTYNSADTTAGPLGQGWTFSYAASLAIGANSVTLRSGDGQQVSFAANSDGTYSGGEGVHARLVKNGDGSFVVTTKAQEHFLFSSAGRLTGITNRNNQGVTLAYDGGGLLTSVSGSGRSLSFTFTGALLTKVTLPDGRYVQYTYTNGLLTSSRDLRGFNTTYTYDAGNRLATIQDANLHTVARNIYDQSTGRVTDQYDARNNHTTFAWDAYTQTTTMTAPDGGVWKNTYSGNILVSETDPNGRTSTFSYDNDLNLLAVTDPAGKSVSFGYDGNGNMTSETDADGASSTYTYDNLNDQTTSRNPLGTSVTYTYDTHGNLTGTSRPNPAGGAALTTSAAYDPVTGLMATSTDARNKTVHYYYDPQGDLTSVVDPLQHNTTYGYDGSGRRTSAVSPRGNVTGGNPTLFTTTYTYDDGDNLTKVTDPLGHHADYTYDSVGNRLTASDANQHVTTYTYWETNQVKTVQPADLTIPATSYTYDANDRLASVTTPYANGTLTTSYGYDQAGQLTSTTSPIGQWTLGYDAPGNRTTSRDPAGNTVTIGYDAMHRVTSLSYSDGTPSVGYTYDADGNRKTMTDGAGTVNYSYDVLDRLTTVSRGSSTFSYGYDAGGHVTSRTFPGQTADAFTYNDDGTLATVTSGGTTSATYGYDEDGDLRTTIFPSANGYTETRSYDNADRLTEIKDANSRSTLARAAYTLDSAGNPLAIVDAAGSTTTYTYDLLERLTAACYSTTTCTGATNYIRWTYDGSGNRLTETRPAGTTNYTYNTKNELAQTSGPSGTTTYGYDLDGNQTSAGTATALFNAAGRMKSSTSGSTTTTYTYDGNGRRLSESAGSTTTQFLWDPIGYQLAEELNGSGTLLRRYAYGNGLISMTEPGATGGPFYYHVDGEGSALAVTNASGSTQWQYTYEPYGATKTTTKASNKAPTNQIGWTGQYSDAPTGGELLRARMYNTATGRFTSADPAGSGDTYGYGNDNPMVFSDPNGTDAGSSYDQFNSVLNPDGGEIVQAEQMACDAGMSCDVQQVASDLYGGAQIAGMVANVDFLKCFSGKGSCASTALNAAIFAAGSFDGEDLLILGVDAERAAEASGGSGGILARLRSLNWADDTGAVSLGGRFSEDQDALIQLAKQAKQLGGLPQDDAEILAEWADELGLSGHGPAIHPGRPGFGGSTVHINIGPIKHIPVLP